MYEKMYVTFALLTQPAGRREKKRKAHLRGKAYGRTRYKSVTAPFVHLYGNDQSFRTAPDIY